MIKKVLIIISFLFLISGCFNNNEKINIQDNNLENENKSDEERVGVLDVNEIIIEVNGKQLVVSLESNSSTEALVLKLKDGDIIVNAHDYGDFEKVGDLGFSLPRNDKQITTKPGDLILYNGNQLTLYYDTNTWSFTKLGEVKNTNKKELKKILGSGDVKLVLKQIK